MRPIPLVAVFLFVAGCSTSPPSQALQADPAAHEAAHVAAAPSSGGRTFGAPLSADRTATPLNAIFAQPEQFRDQVVRTEGEIARVCQAMGCWMELRETADGPAMRVPMAGHAFFLPRDVAGKHAVIEGTVRAQALSDAERAHLESEGAQATQLALAIEASGVVVQD